MRDDRWGSAPAPAGDPAVVGLLARLIQADTSNPPGDVRPALAVLLDFFGANGVEARVVGEAPELGNLIARLSGSGGGRSLLLLGHLDVVPATAAGWSEPPFSGRVRDGYVWGRGALDMKHQLAAQAVAFAPRAPPPAGRRAATSSSPPPPMRRPGCVAARAGCSTRTRTCCAPTSRSTRAAGACRMPPAVPLYVLHVGEKGYANTKLRVAGHAGHGSMPQRRGNAVSGLAEVVAALDAYAPEVRAESIPGELIDLTVQDATIRKGLKDPVTAQRAVRELARHRTPGWPPSSSRCSASRSSRPR